MIGCDWAKAQMGEGGFIELYLPDGFSLCRALLMSAVLGGDLLSG